MSQPVEPFSSEASAANWVQADIPKNVTRTDYDKLRKLAHQLIGFGRINNQLACSIETKLAQYKAAIRDNQDLSARTKVKNAQVTKVFQQSQRPPVSSSSSSSSSSSAAAAAAAPSRPQPAAPSQIAVQLKRDTLGDLSLAQWAELPLPEKVNITNYYLIESEVRQKAEAAPISINLRKKIDEKLTDYIDKVLQTFDALTPVHVHDRSDPRFIERRGIVFTQQSLAEQIKKNALPDAPSAAAAAAAAIPQQSSQVPQMRTTPIKCLNNITIEQWLHNKPQIMSVEEYNVLLGELHELKKNLPLQAKHTINERLHQIKNMLDTMRQMPPPPAQRPSASGQLPTPQTTRAPGQQPLKPPGS